MKPDGGPAFPRPGHSFQGGVAGYGQSSWSLPENGMSLRDYFAAAALAGLVNCEPVADEHDSDAPARQVARDAYRLADAMLAERERSD